MDQDYREVDGNFVAIFVGHGCPFGGPVLLSLGLLWHRVPINFELLPCKRCLWHSRIFNLASDISQGEWKFHSAIKQCVKHISTGPMKNIHLD